MDFQTLPAAESGSVTLLEFTWPWPPGGAEDPPTCISYVVLKRAAVILCLPLGPRAQECPREPCDSGLVGRPDRCSLLPRPCGLWRCAFCCRGPRLVSFSFGRLQASPGGQARRSKKSGLGTRPRSRSQVATGPPGQRQSATRWQR